MKERFKGSQINMNNNTRKEGNEKYYENRLKMER
jgi:hypothetical protein